LHAAAKFCLVSRRANIEVRGPAYATDIIWDLKRQYYCREENQEITRQDVQNSAVRERIQSFVEGRGFPAQSDHNEYTIYFEKMFGGDKERQRKYLKNALSEDLVTLSVGCRVLGALMISGLCRVVFTPNFDSVVEKAVAEMGGQSISAYHLEGSRSAVEALNNEEFPLYCKLHGDFRYDSLKNLAPDLERQNEALSDCLVNASNRLGFIVAGYSGRDASIMSHFHKALDSHNPFPHGLYWTAIKGFAIPASVNDLLKRAREKGVDAAYVPIETFDALLLRLGEI
jgi:SIR2-like domain